MMKQALSTLILFFLLSSNATNAQRKADDIIGTWQTAGVEPARIQIYRVGDKYHGKISWLKKPTDNGKVRVDANNPDNTKRNQPIIGLVILKNFKFDGDDEWVDGTIYDPKNGKTYSCYIYLKTKDILKARGYIGFSMLGRTETWTRVL
jgi:uncharacterized protein (DUF2147 family)